MATSLLLHCYKSPKGVCQLLVAAIARMRLVLPVLAPCFAPWDKKRLGQAGSSRLGWGCSAHH